MIRRRPDRSRKLHCEFLESRQMLAASAVLGWGGVLTVSGTDGDDTLVFRQVKKNISIVGIDGVWSASKVKSIAVNLGGGNDVVSLNSLANGGNQPLKVAVTVNSGGGDERVRLANEKDVLFSGLGHVLKVAADGTATLDGQVVTWEEPAPTPTPDPTPTPEPEPDPTPPPTGNWFDTYVQDAALRTLGSTLYTDGIIDRSDIMAIFQDVQDDGAIDATEFNDLKAIVTNTTLFGTMDYVWKLSSYVVSGNTANAKYQGQTLGNLAAGSSAAQMQNLVNKWFLGLDRPVALSAWGPTYGYSQVSGTLFVNGASYSDIKQGGLADCSFLSSLAETALRSPNTITSMFVVNGDGTYTVQFYRSGVAEFVTVDQQLPTSNGKLMFAGYGASATNTANELWVALAEKAYAQIAEMGWVTGSAINSYASLSYQFISTTLGHITGQAIAGSTSMSATGSFTTFVSAYTNGKLICFASSYAPALSSLVANHAYSVVGYDSAAQTVTLFNPWGISYGLVTMTWSQLQANFSYFDRTA